MGNVLEKPVRIFAIITQFVRYVEVAEQEIVTPLHG